MSEKDEFFSKNKFLRKFLLTQRMPFSQLSRKNFRERPNSNHWLSIEHTKTSLFEKKLLLKCFNGHVECCFDKPRWNLIDKRLKRFRSLFSNDGRKTIVWEVFFIKWFRCTHRLQFWQARVFSLSQGRRFFAHCRRVIAKTLFLFQKKLVFLKTFPWIFSVQLWLAG